MRYFFCVLLIFSLKLSAQSLYQNESKDQSRSSSFGMNNIPNLNEIPAQSGFNYSINENEYYVGSGDIFLIKIDRKGPAIKIFNSPVTPAGYIALPDISGIFVRGKLLSNVKADIIKTLKKRYPDALIETYLFGLHAINVTILAPEKINNSLLLNSSNRLFDAYTQFVESMQMDSIRQAMLDRLSLRNVKLIRKGNTSVYDLREFKINYSSAVNPYLQHEDIVYFSFKDSTAHHVSVKGAVTNPTDFEYKTGDDLIKAFDFAGGLAPNAELNKIIVTRFYENSKIKYITLSMPGDSNFLLQPDDRIYVRDKKQYHIKSSVEIKGEIAFPGEYSIEDGKIRLKDLIELAGGFTEKASLQQARVLRDEGDYEDKEFERLNAPVAKAMSSTELSYLRARNREDTRVVNCDFKRLFEKDDQTQNILLLDKDIIVIPKISKNIYISGGVLNPGVFLYNKNWDFEKYVQAAGGYSARAKEGFVKIIRHRTGNWIDAEENIPIEENDIIFIPFRAEFDTYYIVKETLVIASQLASLFLLYISIPK